MSKLRYIFFLCLLASLNQAQELLAIGDRNIDVNEFEYKYKNNLQYESLQQTLDNFLELELFYQDALMRQIDTLQSFKIIFGQDKNQLTREYLIQKSPIRNFLKQQYQRSLLDRKVDFVTINREQEKLAKRLHNKLSNGLTTVPKILEEHRNNQNLVGVLGFYIRGNQENQILENAFFEPNIGQSTELIATPNGFLFGTVLAEQPHNGSNQYKGIWIEGKTQNAKAKITECYQRLQSGESFWKLSKEFITNQEFRQNGGFMNWIGNNIPKPFISSVNELTELFDYSQPIQVGNDWYIVQLYRQNQCAIDNNKCYQNFVKKYLNSDRHIFVDQILYDSIIPKNLKLNINQNVVNEFLSSIKIFPIQDSIKIKSNQMIFLHEDVNFGTQNLAELININRSIFKNKEDVKVFVNQTIASIDKQELTKRYWRNLGKFDAVFALKEDNLKRSTLFRFYNGIYIKPKVLASEEQKREFYQQNQNLYQIKEPRINADLYVIQSKKQQKEVQELLSNSIAKEIILKQLNTKKKIVATVFTGNYLLSDERLPNKIEPKENQIIPHQVGNRFYVWHVKERINSPILAYEDVQTRVAEDYKQQLYKNKIEELKKSTNYRWNNQTLKQLKQKYD